MLQHAYLMREIALLRYDVSLEAKLWDGFLFYVPFDGKGHIVCSYYLLFISAIGNKSDTMIKYIRKRKEWFR